MNSLLENLVKIALQEDLPDGDITTDSLHLTNGDSEKKSRARLVAKEDLVLSGCEVFALTFQAVLELNKKLNTQPHDIKIQWHYSDGQFVLKGQTICTLTGDFSTLLKGERVGLNFLGHLSGIATLTKCYVNEIKGTKTQILDTRKTTPGLRVLEKQAVRHGGGVNHRMSLSDAVLIKENHIRAAGGITNAVQKIKSATSLPIEVEVQNINEVREALNCQVNKILLDNMSNADMSEALKLIPSSVSTEASGNMSLERIRAIAELGVTFISVGAITHSAPCADISMVFDELVKS